MNPLLLFALLTGGSMVANQAGQRAINSGRERADAKAKEVRDQSYATAEAARQKALAGVQDIPVKQAQAAETRTAALQGAQEPISTRPDLISPEERGSAQVVKEEGRQKGQARDFTNQIAGARGKLDSLGDVMLDQNILQRRTSTDINAAGRDAMNWTQNVLPFQLESANRKGDTYRTIADLFQLGAQLSAGKAFAGKAGAAPTMPTNLPASPQMQPYGAGRAVPALLR
jgi:hypothetical protein